MTDKKNTIITPRQILLVEDDIDLAKLFETYIHNIDFEVTVVYNGEDALKIVSEKYFDLIFLDIMLPGIDGFEVLRQLKANEKTKLIPVIMLTNKGELESMQRGLDLGAADYAVKMAVGMQEIKRLVAKHLIHFNARFNL